MIEKLVIAAMVIAAMTGMWQAQAVRIDDLSRSNGILAAEKESLSSNLMSAEQDKLTADGRIRHLSELLVGITLSKNKARADANEWREKFKVEQENDKDCKSWSETTLPECVINGVFDSGDQTGNDSQGQDGGSTGDFHTGNPYPPAW